MKILIVNYADVDGGAARAAYRLHRSLLKEDVDSKFLVQRKTIDDFTVYGPLSKIQENLGKVRSALDRLPIYGYKQRTKTMFSVGWVPLSNMADRINAFNSDVVHLHWVAGGMLRLEDIALIDAPVVWTLHDMWPFTGGCHYDEYCGAFKVGCGSCKVLSSSKKIDISSSIFQRKLKVYSKKNITVVGLSRWMASEAASSRLFSNCSVVNLPNPIDTNVYAPFEKNRARELLFLPRDKKLVLFGAVGATSDPRKGFFELVNSLRMLKEKNFEVVIFGASRPEKDVELGCKAHYMGTLYDDISLRLLYSAVDVMVVPSLQENLSNAIMESLACGTPVVGFDVGGNSDLIEHEVNGYLARPFDSCDLAKGIDWVLGGENSSIISTAAREKVVRDFEQSLVAKQYIKLYEEILGR